MCFSLCGTFKKQIFTSCRQHLLGLLEDTAKVAAQEISQILRQTLFTLLFAHTRPCTHRHKHTLRSVYVGGVRACDDFDEEHLISCRSILLIIPNYHVVFQPTQLKKEVLCKALSSLARDGSRGEKRSSKQGLTHAHTNSRGPGL